MLSVGWWYVYPVGNFAWKPCKHAFEVKSMKKNIVKTFFLVFFLFVSLVCKIHLTAAQSTNVPIIRIDNPSHTFPTVFEGNTLRHTFTVLNKGTANLNIKKVTPS